MKPLAKMLLATAGTITAAYAAHVATTWWRYGRPRPARGAARDELVDALLPTYDVCERHQARAAAPPAVTLEAATQTDLQASPVVRTIFKARELLMHGHAGPTRAPIGLLDELKALGWCVVAEVPGREIVVGAATRPWEPDPKFQGVPSLATFAEAGYVKIAVSFRVEPGADGGSTFYTETRAVATDAAARRKFRLYWSLLSPGIGLIRAAMVAGLGAAADRLWHLEGDELVPEPRAQLTHAVTIDAPPAAIWPWLIQMGRRRAGWYSWDLLDNGGEPSADRIIPELQHLEPGDVLPWRDQGPEGFTVERVIPERALVLGSTAPGWHGTWAFVLEPLGPHATRLVTRYRAAYPRSARNAVQVPVLAAVHAFMERKQLRSIKDRAEHTRAS